jgi:transcriptional regulator with XRE-family HTH domain
MPRCWVAADATKSGAVPVGQREQFPETRSLFLPDVPLTLKALRKKDYSEDPQTLGEHLRTRRKELGLLQREAGERMGVSAETVANWEKNKTRPIIPSQFKPVVALLGYDPSPAPRSLAERLEAKRRRLGITYDQVAQHLGWDPGSLRRYLDGTWPIPPNRRDALEAFLDAETTALAGLLSLKRRR